ncbi:hypothetical protein HRED_08760 [Candidatus Haloredivivus sp. G17]|nr:hypothetical protein HRED_09832 [Candidatus Haloredivivus sp. G17]EHK01355.1 hypothetical protein HRED_08760 [Candidatus Haloredivivus sp. G17]
MEKFCQRVKKYITTNAELERIEIAIKASFQ